MLAGALTNKPGTDVGETSRGNQILEKLQNDSNLMTTLDVDEGMTSGHVSGQGSPLRGTSAQEKNRRAQKRFRERQKANISSMQDQMASMKEEVERLEKENKDLVARNSMMDKMLRLSNESILSLQENHMKANGVTYQESNDLFHLIGINGTNNIQDDIDESELQLDDEGKGLLSFWKKLVKDASVLLLRYDSIPKEDTNKRQKVVESMEEMLNRAGKVCMQVAVYNPANFQVLMGSSLDQVMHETPKDKHKHWSAVLDHLDLDLKQKHQLAALNDIFKERMGNILQACSEKLSALRQLGPSDEVKCLENMVKKTIDVKKTAKELQLRMCEEHLCRIELWATVFKTVLSEVQKARFIVHSYPFFPDVFEVANLISIAADEEGAQFNNNVDNADGADHLT